MADLRSRKYERDREEVLRILRFHQAIVEEGRNGTLDEDLVERSAQFARRMSRDIVAMGEPEPEEMPAHIEKMLHLIMRLHREATEAHG